jgi:hypothetical protein
MREIHDLTQKHLRSIRGDGRELIQPVPPLEQRFEDLMLRMGAGRRAMSPAAPSPAGSGPPVPAELLKGIPEHMRHHFQYPRHRQTLDEAVRNYADAEILEAIAWNVRWMGADAVVDRIVSHVRAIASGDKAAGRKGRAFLRGLARAATPTKARNRGKYYDEAKVAVLFHGAVRLAQKVQEQYSAIRAAHPDWLVLELAREMIRSEESVDRRPEDGAVKQVLAELCAIVPARDRSRNRPRLLTIEHQGWPRAASYALLSNTLELSYRTIRRAVGSH